MGFKEENKYHEYGSMFMGAIFMANKETKQECLKRKLFGLPLSKTSFMKQIKAGMLLFLFEHEERKLYGVFEATSDGALNIIPNAYISSGKSFPAQVLFRRLWMCKPLLEKEFRDAIKENYYQQKKFNFGLSYEQVFKLIHLFSLKRIRLNLYQRQERPNNIIAEFEMCGGDNDQVTGEASSLEASSREHSTNDCVDLKTYTGLSRSNANYPSYEERFTTSQSSLGSIGHESLETAPLGIERHPSYSGHPTFPSDPSIRSKFLAHPSHDYVNYQYFPGSGGEVPSVTLGGSDDPPLLQEQNTWIPSSIENRISRSTIHPLHTGGYNYSSHNHWSSPFPTSNVSLPPAGLEGQPNPHKHNPHKHLTPERYDPSNPRMSFSRLGNVTDGRMDSLTSLCDPFNAEGHNAVTQSQFDSRGQQCWDLGPPSDYIPLPGDADLDRIRLPSHLTSPQRDLSASSYSGSEEDDDYDELRPYPPTHANQYDGLTGINARLHSDAEQGRRSVFSRLSKVSERRNKHESCERDSRVTLDQLVKLLSQRREEIIKARYQLTTCDDDEQSGSIAMTEINEAGFLDDMLNSSDVAVDEESVEAPFLSFKRRSKIRRTVGEMETSDYVESGENEEVLGKNKRRKLVRPSLNDECQNLYGTSSETVEVQPLVEVGENIADKGESSPDPNPGYHPHCIRDAETICENDEYLLGEKGEPSPDPKPGYLTSSITNGEKITEYGESSLEQHGYLGTTTTENVTEASRDCVQVSNRNLRWFLQKTT